MSRPLRLEFAGACYHLTARGDRQEPIFDDDGDRLVFLDLLAKEVLQRHHEGSTVNGTLPRNRQRRLFGAAATRADQRASLRTLCVTQMGERK